MDINAILEQAVKENVSDVFIVAGRPVSFRQNGIIKKEASERLLPEDTRLLLGQGYALADHRDIAKLEDGDDDFSLSIPSLSRFRVSAFKQRGSLSAVIRVITYNLPDPKDLGIPTYIISPANSAMDSASSVCIIQSNLSIR